MFRISSDQLRAGRSGEWHARRLAVIGLLAALWPLCVMAETGAARERVNLRAEPDLTARIVAVLARGAAVEVLASAGEFVRVRRLADGAEGYLRRRMLVFAEAGSLAPPGPVAASAAAAAAPPAAAPTAPQTPAAESAERPRLFLLPAQNAAVQQSVRAARQAADEPPRQSRDQSRGRH